MCGELWSLLQRLDWGVLKVLDATQVLDLTQWIEEQCLRAQETLMLLCSSVVMPKKYREGLNDLQVSLGWVSRDCALVLEQAKGDL
ncbi:hypothetical protein N7532_008682 [Penicillium argentinense]|uniref:Uncharacterized protein n=1 Tax=Penicillium argentinense TaxID=1131581 RepID=A0A9W9K1W4_9EURO|nr:uncharacterized protein N7532_008682 [Penicillium argentinense]KAJ5089998.1 hypothetical protein N7532_008682 [Penicillium argentinense]